MKIPSEEEIEGAFHALRQKSLSVAQWIEYSRWSRFDPRLAEGWIAALAHQWKKLNPVELNAENSTFPSPAAFGVLLDQCADYLISKPDQALFRKWRDVVMEGTEIAPGELFLIGVHPFGSPSLLEEMAGSSKYYRRWGFGGKDIFVNKFLQKQKARPRSALTRKIRLSILEALVRRRERIRTQDYLAACEYRVSPRVAQKDLATCGFLVPHGKSQARFYTRARKPRQKA